MEVMPVSAVKTWAKTVKKCISTATGLEHERVFRQWQNGGSLTSFENCASFSLNKIDMEGKAYATGGNFKSCYFLDYLITFYGDEAQLNAQRLLGFMFVQDAKDILYPAGLAYISGFSMAGFAEFINGRAYNRTDVNLKLSAALQDDTCDHIDSLDISFKTR